MAAQAPRPYVQRIRVICRAGHQPGAEHSRVFQMTPTAWENVGTARRGALKFGEDVINGLIPGESVASL